jgi:hypothetical protein
MPILQEVDPAASVEHDGTTASSLANASENQSAEVLLEERVFGKMRDRGMFVRIGWMGLRQGNRYVRCT